VNSYLADYTLTEHVEQGQIMSSGTANLTGNALNNTLYAGDGDNVLTGGNGVDTVSWGYATSGVTVDLNSTGSQDTGGSGHDTLISIERLTGSAYEDHLIGDANDNKFVGGAGDDTLDGGDGDDELESGDGADMLVGGLGADVLNGGKGYDVMIGGDGGDTYYVDDAGDVVNEALGEGTDRVNSYLTDYNMTPNVEQGRIMSTGAARLTGNASNNILYAGDGNNVLDGGEGVDTVSWIYAISGVTVDLNDMGAQDTGGSGHDMLISIESLAGGAFNDLLIGNQRSNVIAGGAGMDTITGGGGNDKLTGDAAADVFVFGDLSGADRVADFSTSQGDKLKILINVNGSGITDAASVLARTADNVAGDAVVDLTGGNTITLTGVSTASLSVADFVVF